jgi:hypothetical protein
MILMSVVIVAGAFYSKVDFIIEVDLPALVKAQTDMVLEDVKKTRNVLMSEIARTGDVLRHDICLVTEKIRDMVDRLIVDRIDVQQKELGEIKLEMERVQNKLANAIAKVDDLILMHSEAVEEPRTSID